jgi:hypothetical protein
MRSCFPIRVTTSGQEPDLIAAYRVERLIPRASAATATVSSSALELGLFQY